MSVQRAPIIDALIARLQAKVQGLKVAKADVLNLTSVDAADMPCLALSHVAGSHVYQSEVDPGTDYLTVTLGVIQQGGLADGLAMLDRVEAALEADPVEQLVGGNFHTTLGGVCTCARIDGAEQIGCFVEADRVCTVVPVQVIIPSP